MYNQISLFEFFPSDNFCSYSDINELRFILHELLDRYEHKVSKEDFSVWNHVPDYGFRYEMFVYVGNLDDKFFDDLSCIIKNFKLRNVNLSVSSFPTFYNDLFSQQLFFSSYFMDSRVNNKFL